MTTPAPDPVALPAHKARGWYGHYSWLDASVRWLTGRLGDLGAGQLVVVDEAAPDPADKTPRLHVQTGLGPDGSGMTLWIEDGTP